jgi:NAD(P)-dependent dehydrogenase (short-subunit alcohol dehydrogenase family)
MEQLTGKVAFITGGASGIGLGMARAFLEEGMKVSLADWNDEHIAKAREQLAGNNAVHFVKTNVAERDSLRNAAQETLDAFGKIHVLCNNAGVNGGGTAASDDFDDWDRAHRGQPRRGGQRHQDHRPDHPQQGEGGHVVNTSSMAGVVPLPGLAAYSTAKYAVRGFSESLRMQLAKDGIGVSCLFPGATRTALVPLPEDDPEHIKEEARRSSSRTCGTRCAGRSIPTTPARRWSRRSRQPLLHLHQPRVPRRGAAAPPRDRGRLPGDEPTPGRVKFEQMRAEMVRNLMAPATARCRRRATATSRSTSARQARRGQ